MLSPFANDPSPPERRQKPNYRFPYRRDSIGALIAAPRYHKDVARPADLVLSQPRFHAKTRVGGSRQRFSQIENVFLTERRFVESPEDVVRRFPAGAHAEVRDRRALAECLARYEVVFGSYLHCAGAPAGNPNAVVTAIFQPSAVLTKTRSETPLDVVSFCVTV